MKLYLTSSPTGPLDNTRPVKGMDEMNGFRESLKKNWRPDSRCLMVSATPDEKERNEEMRCFFENALIISGLSVSEFTIWDSGLPVLTREEVQAYDVILLGGGHVPTMHAFLERIGLREKLADFDGIVIGISAGTMNAEEVIYAQPEEPGEAVDPAYERWLPGLGLTKTMILPHYQMVKNYTLDGMRLFEDITYADSVGNEFLALTDGAYLYSENGRETVYGESYRIADGEIEPLCGTDECVTIREAE